MTDCCSLVSPSDTNRLAVSPSLSVDRQSWQRGGLFSNRSYFSNRHFA
jgi:hypothetical protein